MDERVARVLPTIRDFGRLAQYEANLKRQGLLGVDETAAIRDHSALLGRALITDRTGIDLTELTPAEERIVEAVSEYAGVLKRQGRDASRTLTQLRNRGLIEAAEASVSRSTPTKGYEILRDENLENLSYEQIVVDHPEEFSPRAIWYARKTLGLHVDGDRPPTKETTAIQLRTEQLISWLAERALAGGGRIGHYADAARAIGMNDLSVHGRAYGNLQSRLDFACYRQMLPPLGLTAAQPFENAWGQEDRTWAFPKEAMKVAAQSRHWTSTEFDRIAQETGRLSGRAYILWKTDLRGNQQAVHDWAFGL